MIFLLHRDKPAELPRQGIHHTAQKFTSTLLNVDKAIEPAC
jgi:hypothetical protein